MGQRLLDVSQLGGLFEPLTSLFNPLIKGVECYRQTLVPPLCIYNSKLSWALMPFLENEVGEQESHNRTGKNRAFNSKQ